MNKPETYETRRISPFLRWAGGKRWFVEKFHHLFDDFDGQYIEPFLGSGAAFFHLKPNNGILSDVNSDLITTYQEIRNNHKLVERAISRLKDDNIEYYEVRSWKPDLPCDIAARFIYLNRTCWNGLWRVNLKGNFNVPKGTKDINQYPVDDFEEYAKLLKQVELKRWDFKGTISIAKRGDFIFADPPYTVRHNNNGFIKYNENIFSWENQIELSKSLLMASERGAKVLCTNANHESVRELYPSSHFKKIVVERYSSISSKKSTRSSFQELVIKSR